MIRVALAAFVGAILAGGAQAAPAGSCDDMVARFDAYLKAHPNATGALPQSVGAQLMHQPTRESIDKAKKQGRAHLEALLAKAKAEQQAKDESGCQATLAEVKWMLQP
ncbi:MAG TPA: hypothetical protein VN715_15890 [Roseiarcus sp.]|nr:hypothetical protein [Roseiarcus sp.]